MFMNEVAVFREEDKNYERLALKGNSQDKSRRGAGHRKVFDRDFLCRLRDGDHRAFETLYLRYMPAIRNFLIVLTRSNDVGNEIAQDVFVKLWKRLEHVDPDKDIGSYLYKIAKNEAFNYLDKLKRIRTEYFETYEQYEDTGATPDQEYFAREMELIVDIALSRMPPRQRNVFELSRKERMSNTDIAELLQISKSTVENHITTALNDLRKVYAKYAHVV
jgi:RNA polymerase sigma-70 factor (ECF subfamily)